jgi:hypothetical protein
MNNPLPTAEVEAVEPASADQIAKVRDLAEKAVALDEEMAELGERLAKLSEQKKVITERDLVNAMTEARLETWPMPGGFSFDLTTLLNASIPKDRQDEAFAFLEDHGHGDLIKRKFTIQFGRDEVAWAKKFMQDLAKRKKPLNVEQKIWVEPQTLGAFVREQHRNAAATGTNADELVPPTLFGVFKMTYAKLSAPKAAKERAVRSRK